MDSSDLTGVVATFMGIVLVMIPVAGLTLRFAVKPVLTPLVKAVRDLKEGNTDAAELNSRLLLLEEDMDEIKGSLRRLVETQSFDRRLATSDGKDSS